MLVARTGLHRVLQFCDSALSRQVRVLAYHRVLPRLSEEVFEFDVELISAWQEEFDWQMRYLARNFEPITCRQLAALMDSGDRVPSGAVIVTFDDGYQDNHRVAMPILKSHRVPAVIFVATGYVGTGAVFWYDRLANAMLKTSRLELRVDWPGTEVVRWEGAVRDRRRALRGLLAGLKASSQESRIVQLSRWLDELGVSGPEIAETTQAPMTWDELREIDAAGIEIGAHSVTHPVLSRIEDLDELNHEIAGSKQAIEREIGRPVISMAYPVGGPTAYNAMVIDQVRKAGYRFAFTYMAGRNRVSAMDPMQLRRLAVERYTSRDRFRAMLASSVLA